MRMKIFVLLHIRKNAVVSQIQIKFPIKTVEENTLSLSISNDLDTKLFTF